MVARKVMVQILRTPCPAHQTQHAEASMTLPEMAKAGKENE